MLHLFWMYVLQLFTIQLLYLENNEIYLINSFKIKTYIHILDLWKANILAFFHLLMQFIVNSSIFISSISCMITSFYFWIKVPEKDNGILKYQDEDFDMHHGTFLYPITVYFLSTKNLLSPSIISKGKNQEHPHVLQ